MKTTTTIIENHHSVQDYTIQPLEKTTLKLTLDKTVEKEIIDLKNNAPEKINKIAIETSSDLIKKLIGIDVNKSSISAIVENFSKKNKDKYYGL